MHKALRQLFFMSSLCCTHIVWAQQPDGGSPYSLAALGELKSGGFVQHQGMGRNSRALKDPFSFSPVNPASYSALNYTVYEAGSHFNTGRVQTDALSSKFNNANFGYFAMAFGLPEGSKGNMGFSFGIHQVSDVQYNIKKDYTDSIPSYALHRGSGGLHAAYLGMAFEPIKNLAIGANLKYNFGNIKRIKARVYPENDDIFSFSDETYLYYEGLNYDLGVQYTVQTKGLYHTLAATWHSEANLQGGGYRYAETFIGRLYEDGGRLETIDTLAYDDNLSSTALKPGGMGIAYALSKPGKWVLSLEYELNKWSEVYSELNGEKFFDNSRYSMGFSIIPRPEYEEKGNYMAKVRYSVGLRYENLYYNYFDTPVNEVGISFGLGLPVVKVFRGLNGKIPIVSRVNLTVDYTRRGNTTSNLIQEDYLSLSIGLNFNDKWFIKRKYQ